MIPARWSHRPVRHNESVSDFFPGEEKLEEETLPWTLNWENPTNAFYRAAAGEGGTHTNPAPKPFIPETATEIELDNRGDLEFLWLKFPAVATVSCKTHPVF